MFALNFFTDRLFAAVTTPCDAMDYSTVQYTAESKTKEVAVRRFKYEEAPPEEIWGQLDNDVKYLILHTLYTREGVNSLKTFGEVSRGCRDLVYSLVSYTFQNAIQKGTPSIQYLSQIKCVFPKSHKKSSSHPLFHAYLQRRDGVSLQPTVIQCNLRKENPESCEPAEIQYQKLKLLLTENLEKFELTLPVEDYIKVTASKSAETEFKGRLSEILFGLELTNLAEFKISFYAYRPIGWCNESALKEADVHDLEKLTPNLRYLRFRGCSIEDGFFEGLLDSPLLAELESLTFEDCPLQQFNSLAYFFGEAQMPNLKIFTPSLFSYKEKCK